MLSIPEKHTRGTAESDGSREHSADAGFLRGAAVLGGAGLAAKAVGALYRIPLANVLGAEGSGYYGIVYPVYSALAAISTIGIPTAISHLIAGNLGLGRHAAAERIFNAARRFMLILGAVLSAVLFVFAAAVSDIVQEPPTQAAFQAIAPAFLFACVLSCYRGVLQGFAIMKPTAVSQVLEQFGKLGISLTSAWVVTRMGGPPSSAAAAALGGIAGAEGIAALYMKYAYEGSTARAVLESAVHSRQDKRGVLRRVIAAAVPITAGACMLPLILAIDSVLAASALQASGMGAARAASQVGLLTMNVEPLVNLPSALSGALAASVVPDLSRSYAYGQIEGGDGRAQLAVRMTLIIGLPCAAGFAMLGRPIISLLFGSLSENGVNTAGAMLQIMSMCVLCLTFVQTATGILQGAGHKYLPIAAMCAGALIKVLATAPFVRAAGIPGAAWSSVLCFAAAAVLSTYFVGRFVPHSLPKIKDLAKLLAATGLMAASAAVLYSVLQLVSPSAATVCSVIFGAAAYAASLCRLGCVSIDEAALLPGGRKFVALGLRLGLWRDGR